MSTLEAIVLGIIQGATEFLPISSSGHLVLGKHLLGLEDPELLFDIILHVGTLVAVVAFYRREVLDVLRGLATGLTALFNGSKGGNGALARFLEPSGARLAALVVIASVPTALIGVTIDKSAPPDQWSVIAVCVVLVINGFVLFAGRFADRVSHDDRDGLLTLWNITPAVALALGIAQGIAVLPGLSRSGMTIISALFLGVWRGEAARFSFLMSIPAILGALVLKFDPGVFSGAGGSALPVYLAGAGIAAVVGYFAILYLEKLVANAQFHHFSWYCWAIGTGGVAALLLL